MVEDLDIIDESTNYLEETKTTVKSFDFNEYLESEKLKGFLKKRDLSIFKMYQKKWFLLKEGKLLYYNNQQTNSKKEAPEGIISLLAVMYIEPTGSKRFTIKLQETEYYLEATSPEERDYWVHGLRDALEICRSLEKYVYSNRDFQITKEDSRKEGLLDRKFYTGWKAVRVIVQDGMLYSYSLRAGTRKDKIALYGSKWEEVLDRPNAWKIETEDGRQRIYLAASTDVEMMEWINFLLKQIVMMEDTINSITFD